MKLSIIEVNLLIVIKDTLIAIFNLNVFVQLESFLTLTNTN